MSGSRAHEGVIEQGKRRTERGKGKVKQVSANIGTRREEKKSEALIPLLFQLRSVRSQEALDKSNAVGLSVYNYSATS